jgi:ribosomal RNA-processing protein 36
MSDEDSYISNEKDDFSEQHDEQEDDEEQQIQNELDEMELGKLVQAKTKIVLENEMKSLKSKSDGKIDKKQLEEKFTELNKQKKKTEPKEFSALFKPKNVKKIVSEDRFRRDPRFDDMSGNFNPVLYKKNYLFVNEQSKEYLNKIQELKNKKKKKKLDDNNYELMKKQVNFVKGWLKSKEYEETKDKIEKEFKTENKDRVKQGINPIYVKKSVMKKVVNDVQKGKRSGAEEKEFLKKKKHREVVKNIKSQINFKSETKK